MQEIKSQEAQSLNVNEIIDNMMRILAMLEKALKRVIRRNYFNRTQYPQFVLDVENTINALRLWISQYRLFACMANFSYLVALAVQELTIMIGELVDRCAPLSGKKREKKSHLQNEYDELCCTIQSMIGHIGQYLGKLRDKVTIVRSGLENALYKAFEKHFSILHKGKDKGAVSSRGEKSYVFPYSNRISYMKLVSDRQSYRLEVVDKLHELVHETGHKENCKGKKYKMIGFRKNPRKVVMVGGKQEIFPIRMVQCKGCGEKFSLLPSFLPREKHFGIEIIAQAFQNLVRFSQSIQGILENVKSSSRKVSKQTIYNWIRWIGSHHPATILTRAGVTGSGYLQEDEGFEKEPQLRTYSVVMVEPETQLVWHMDYVDSVDEETLVGSFEKFLEKIEFKVLGVTKDKWQASTNALKSVFRSIWIGFCHRHCLKKFWKALEEYQKETKCSYNEVKRLYNEVKKILEFSNSKVSLEVKLDLLKDDAFKHPLLQTRLNELKENASYYTAHKRRKGITKTTSIVDNFLKIIKRKLRQSESFRDQECSWLLFNTMANVRNFLPFLSGAKNAHKSPFMIAGGETYDLPWIQAMNVHNAFLFTEGAF